MNEVKYPVVVRVNGQQSYQWLTLAQANERFVVVNNCLIVNNVEPLTLDYCQVLLEQANTKLFYLKDSHCWLQTDLKDCENNERFVLEYLQPKIDTCKLEINKAEQDIDFLTKAIDFLNS